MNSADDKQYMTAHDVSAYLRISLSTVHHLTRAGKLTSVKVGKQWRYDKEEINHALEKSLGSISLAYAGNDRRAYERRKCFVQGFAVISRGQEGAWIGEGRILNLSYGGLLFEASEGVFYDPQAYPNPAVKLRLMIDPDHKREYEVDGIIVRAEDAAKTRFAVRFRKLVPELAQDLEALTVNN